MAAQKGVTRRAVLLGGAGAVVGLSGCGTVQGASPSAPRRLPVSPVPRPGPAKPAVQLIGDGSTAHTGQQPSQPKPDRLTPGERPPQFVVVSWDGAGELDRKLFSRFRAVASELNASMTFFLTGLYMLPESKRMLYHGPRHAVGASDIGFLNDKHVRATIEQVGKAWSDGHEIGTHFNGHFCGDNGVGLWNPPEWKSEIAQAVSFVQRWRTNTGITDLPPLPFDYATELIGGRTPCLEGQLNLLPAARDLGWKYDASSPGGQQVWPSKKLGLWDFPLQSVPFPGHRYEVLSMDYNMMANQSGKSYLSSTQFGAWRQQAERAYLAGFQRAFATNRAPYFIGNHFEDWNGGIYMDAVEAAIRVMADSPGVQMVSFKQLVAWLDAQDPTLLTQWRTLQPGQAPAGGWRSFAPSPARTRPPTGKPRGQAPVKATTY